MRGSKSFLLVELETYLFEVVYQAFLGRLERKVAREGSHEVVDGREIVLGLHAEDGQLVVDLAFKGIDCLCPIVEAPALLVEFLVSSLFLSRVLSRLGLVAREVTHVQEQPAAEAATEILRVET